jgi:signal transduction histidine kinase
MKFKWKILLICMGVYFITLAATGAIVITSTYNSMMNREIERCLDEEENTHLTLTLYLLSNKKLFGEGPDIDNFASSVVDMFATQENYMEVYGKASNLLASNLPYETSGNRDELRTALTKGRNYVLRKVDGKHLIYITNVVSVHSSKLIVCTVKDITYIDEQRTKLNKYFMEAAIAGLAIVTFFILGMAKVVLLPVYRLIDATKSIASGNFKQRVQVSSSDEMGVLGEQFNIMADEVENKIFVLEDETQRKQRFIDNLTHELKTPLTSIIGYSALLQQLPYDEETFHKSIGYINSEGVRMQRMISNLMSMILTRENPLDRRSFDIRKLMEDVHGIMLIKSEDKGVELRLRLQECVASIDYDVMKQVVMNLVDNAINACNSDGKVTLGCGHSEKGSYLYVEDTGKGISQEQIQKITEPFYRVDKARSRKDGGAGLGLAISSEFVKKHSANMKIESEIGKGTTVTIEF